MAAVAVVGGGLTLAHVWDPDLLTVHAPTGAAVLETAATVAALLLACLAYGRWHQRGLLSDLLVCYGLNVLAAGKMVFVIAPVMGGMDTSRPALHAGALIAGASAALFLLLAVLVPVDTPASARRPALDLTVVLSVVLLVALGVGLLGSAAATTLAGLRDFVSTDATGDRGNVGITTMQSFTAVVLAVTSVVIIRRRRWFEDSFFAWLAIATALWALSRVDYVFTPPRLAESITLGDWLRLAAYVVLVVAAVRELHAYWQRLAELAVLEERRRIARELHDGLAQELAFIAGQSVVLTRRHPESTRHKLLRSAAERALDESRRGIAALTRPIDEPLHVTLAQTAEEVAGRLGARIHLELAECVQVRNDQRENLLRITREAVTNAVRHGEASSVTVCLANHDGVTLEIKDAGRGFDLNDLDHLSGRLGLQSMRERAESMGATFDVASRRLGGTVVTVRLP